VETLWQALLATVVGCTLLSTLRVAVVGLGHLPSNPTARFVSHDGWNATLVLLLPWFLGSFARREVSPLPWTAFSAAAARHGIVDGILELAIVLIVDLWLLWIPAHSYVRNHPDLDRRVVIMARVLNLAIGLLLITPDNPVYNLLILIPPRDPDDYGY
jgi:hypothetical protein